MHDLIQEVKKLLLCHNFQSQIEFDIKYMLKPYYNMVITDTVFNGFIENLSKYFETLRPRVYDYVINKIPQSKYCHELDIRVYCADTSILVFGIIMKI
jgi:hypothetical protein